MTWFKAIKEYLRIRKIIRKMPIDEFEKMLTNCGMKTDQNLSEVMDEKKNT